MLALSGVSSGATLFSSPINSCRACVQSDSVNMLRDFSRRQMRVVVHNESSEKHSRIFVVHFGLQIDALQYNYGKEAADRCIGKMSFNSLMVPSLRFKNMA